MNTQNLILSGETYTNLTTTLVLVLDVGYYFTTDYSDVSLVVATTQPPNSTQGVIISYDQNNFPVLQANESIWARPVNPEVEVEIAVTEY